MTTAQAEDLTSLGETPTAHETPTASASESPRKRPTAKSIACGRCHSRKVKCSGGQPCQHCRQAGKAAECSYPRPRRMVKVSQRYLDDIISENERLRSQAASDNRPIDRHDGRPPTSAGQPPSLDQSPWFFHLDGRNPPVLIGEAADGVFATRFRQAVLGKDHGHLLRVNYAADDVLYSLSDADCAWPSPPRARFLIDVAMRYVGRFYHIVRRSAVREALDQTLRDGPSSVDAVATGKLWALFAIGEMYSSRSAPGVGDRGFPGVACFARATRTLRVICERPRADQVELRLLLVYYSLALNRRHAAYTLAGAAVRLAVVIGLHLNVPASQLSDVAAREHRVRLFWTAFHFDRLCAANLGNPAAIDEADIHVDLPCDQPTLEGTAAADDFGDAAYINARIRLTRVSARIVQSIYGSRVHKESLSQRVQQALRELSSWVEELPASLHINSKESGISGLVPRPISLRLYFNQCMVNATRPILLHVLRTHTASWAPIIRIETSSGREETREAVDPVLPVPAMAMEVADTCIRCARHSVRLLTEAWVDGSYGTFRFLYTQYLFSAATCLAISSLLPGRSNGSDGDQFETAAQILLQIKNCGAFSGEEFCRHIDAIRVALKEGKRRSSVGVIVDDGDRSQVRAGQLDANSKRDVSTGGEASHLDPVASQRQQPTWAQPNEVPVLSLLEPSLQELLSQSTPDVQFIDASTYIDTYYTQGLYWPEMPPGGWTPDAWAEP